MFGAALQCGWADESPRTSERLEAGDQPVQEKADGGKAGDADEALLKEYIERLRAYESSEEADVKPTVIGHVHHRSHKITIYAHENEERYSVYDPDGHLIAEQVDEAELLAQHPDLHKIVSEGHAGEPIMMRYDKPSTTLPYVDMAPTLIRFNDRSE